MAYDPERAATGPTANSTSGGGTGPTGRAPAWATGGGGPTDIQQFQSLLEQFQPRFLEVADQLRDIAGGEDPRFEAFRQSRLGDVSARNAEFFGRRGTAGSTASHNQLQRSTDQVTAQLGMAQLARQDQARMSSLDVLRGFLENETIPIQLRLQMLAAQNAGDSGGGSFLSFLGL